MRETERSSFLCQKTKSGLFKKIKQLQSVNGHRFSKLLSGRGLVQKKAQTPSCNAPFIFYSVTYVYAWALRAHAKRCAYIYSLYPIHVYGVKGQCTNEVIDFSQLIRIHDCACVTGPNQSVICAEIRTTCRGAHLELNNMFCTKTWCVRSRSFVCVGQ